MFNEPHKLNPDYYVNHSHIQIDLEYAFVVISRLQDRIDTLEEKLQTLSSLLPTKKPLGTKL